MTGPTDYLSSARDQLIRFRAKTVKRFQSIRETPPKSNAVRIVFRVTWGWAHNVFVYVVLYNESNNDIAPRKGFGPLLTIDPPTIRS